MSVSATTNGIRPGVCTSTNRPTNPFDGQVIYMSDTNETAVWNGSYWEGLDKSRDRNVVINGAMQVAQRGTSTAGITTSTYYTADRWVSIVSNLGTWTQSVENDAPTGSGLRKSLKMLCTTADAAPAAGDIVIMQQRVEGYNVQQFLKGTASAKSFILTFWVKSNVTGTFIAEIADIDNTRQVSKSYTISASGTWEKKTIDFGADTTGVFDNDNASSLFLNFHMGAGTDYTSGTLNTSWAAIVTANRAVGQTNVASATNNYFQITGVQLEAGSVATPFEFEDYGTTLRKCQRYYYRLEAGGGNADIASGVSNNTTTIFALVNFPTTLRVRPTTIETTGTASNYYVRRGDTGTAVATTLPTYNTASPSSCWIWSTAGSSFFTAGQGGFIGLIGAQNAYLAWSAEL